jgi:hypothetical protein
VSNTAMDTVLFISTAFDKVNKKYVPNIKPKNI